VASSAGIVWRVTGARDDAEAHDVRIRQHPAGICGVAGVGGTEGGAVEGGGGGVDQRELAARLQAGEVGEQVGALGRREHEPVRRHAPGGAEQPVVGADLGDPVEFGFTVAEQHQPVGAGVGAVEDAQAVGGRLHLQQRPDLAVDDREGRKGLHHLWVGLMDQLAGQPSGLVEAEVAVLDEQRHLERRPLGQAELALAPVPDDP